MSSQAAAHSVTHQDIYLGFWTNWSHGAIRGATLTLKRRDGGFLLAFLALFVTVAGTSFWRIACFAIHRIRSSEGAADGIYHQIQAILRNATDATSALWGMLRIAWVWRGHKTSRPRRRILPWAIFTLVMVAAFTLASIFSSEVSTSMGNEVLLTGSNCGIRTLDGVDTTSYWSSFVPYRAQRTVASMNYAQGCYRGSSSAPNCATFLRRSLPWTRTEVACPFPGQEKICRENSTNLRLDSGYIDSHFDLGINAPPEDRFLFRTVVECAPLHHEGYMETGTVDLSGNGTAERQFRSYLYGSQANGNPVTYQYPVEMVATSDYTLYVQWAFLAPNSSFVGGEQSFSPIPDLQRPMADQMLAFLSANDVSFAGMSNDSWYSAHRLDEALDGTTLPGQLSIYRRDDPVRVLGCTTQEQYCLPGPDPMTCTPLTGSAAAGALATDLWHTEAQRRAFNWTYWATSNALPLPGILADLGVSALTARYKRSDGIQGPLANNQWQLEVEHWFTIALADLQRTLVETATGPLDPSVTEGLALPQTPEQQRLCHNQKIRSDTVTSFSVLGLGLLLGFGGLMIGLSYTLEFLVEWIQNRKRVGTYKHLEWTTNETLQLQRLAHEECGFGHWTRTADYCPITEPGELLAEIDISDPTHPRLQQRSSVNPGADLKPSTTATTEAPLRPHARRGSTSSVSGGNNTPTTAGKHADHVWEPVSPDSLSMKKD